METFLIVFLLTAKRMHTEGTAKRSAEAWKGMDLGTDHDSIHKCYVRA